VFANAFRIGSISGIAIRVDPSWFLIAALFAFGFWGYFAQYGHDTLTAVTLAVAAALLFFASVLAHELGHALEAQHRGVEVGGITLFLFGGVTETKFDVKRPFDEFALTAVGPYVSFVMAAVFGLIATGAAHLGIGWLADLSGVLGWINLLLAIFNLLPGAPLDGGRILRAAVWKVTDDRPRAIRVAARVGQGLGLAVIALGLAQALLFEQLLAGLFNAFIGWFLYQAAGAEHRHTSTRALLEDRTIGEVIGGPPDALPAHLPLDETARAMARTDADVHPVEEHGEVVGVVHVRDVGYTEQEQRNHLPVRTVMRPLADVEAVPHHTPVLEVVEDIDRRDVIAILEEGRVVGLITRSDLERSLQRYRELQGDVPSRRRRSRPRDGHIPDDPRQDGVEVEGRRR
jgi:Zn-dependent protease/CBS domain-containing protein